MSKVFVIDDDKQLLRMLGLMLERGGYDVELIDNPRVGLQRLEEEKPDALILDVMMPGMSGHEVCRHIRSTPEIADLPVLILTARGQVVDRIAALESGADEYLSKPVTSQELLIKLGDLIAQRQLVPPRPQKGFMISCFGLRGGVGRTTLAVNLAAALRRLSQDKVALLDYSVSGAQAGMHLRMPIERSWGDMVNHRLLESEDWDDYLLTHKSGLEIVSAPMITRPLDQLQNGMMSVSMSIKNLREKMCFTIVDLPPLLTPEINTILTKSDMVLHLLTPDSIGVKVAAQTQKVLLENNLQLKTRIFVLNHVSPQPGLGRTAIEKGLKTRVSFNVGYDKNQTRALTQGIPLTLTSAQSPLPVTVKRIAQAIWKRVQTK